VHGVNRSGSEYACIQGWGFFDGPADSASVQAIANWNVNMVRVPINEDCWLGINGSPAAFSGQNYRNAIVNYVNLLHQNGMYAEITLMWTAPGTAQATFNPQMPDKDHAPAAWTSIATTFKNDPAVIFGTSNEPHNVAWACWRDGGSACNLGFAVAGFQELVTTIRQTGATQPITISGINFASDMTQWLAYKPTDPLNALVAEAHIYGNSPCSTPTCLDAQLLPVANTVPMIWGEVGPSYDASDCGSSRVSVIVPWAMAHTVGVEAWTWDTWGNCSALIANYNGTAFSGYGQWVHDYYLSIGVKTVPGAPTNVVAVGGNASATVSWTAPLNGWSPITSYTVSSAPAGGVLSVSGSSTLATVTGLTNGTSYTFSVTATNAVGTGPASAPSNAVIPGVPVVVSAVSPSNGPAAGGTVVTITGTNFSTTGITVAFGAAPATAVSCASTTSCNATSPAGSGAVDVLVTVGGQTSATSPADQFSYVPGAVFSDGFESGTLAAWDGTLGPGSVSVLAAAAHTGSFGARLADSAGQYAVLGKRLPSSLTDSYTRFAVRFTGTTGTTTVAYGRDDSNNVTRWILYYDPGSQGFTYYIFNGAGLSTGITTGSGVAPLNTWVTVELRYTGTASGGGQIWVNDVTQPSWAVSGDFSNPSPYRRLQLWNDAVGTSDIDDVTVSTLRTAP
jgi:endoglucanase